MRLQVGEAEILGGGGEGEWTESLRETDPEQKGRRFSPLCSNKPQC